MKSILMSIKPKWVEKIASGEKTVEVRKTVPKCETPFKVYMYCTNPKLETVQIIKKGESIYGDMLHTEETPLFIKTYSDADEALYSMFKSGKVVGEFVCDEVENIDIPYPAWDKSYLNPVLDKSRLTYKELHDYGGSGKRVFGLHISDLKIYDKPKALSEFWTIKCNNRKTSCGECDYKPNCIKDIDRPPQSWCYVKEMEV